MPRCSICDYSDDIQELPYSLEKYNKHNKVILDRREHKDDNRKPGKEKRITDESRFICVTCLEVVHETLHELEREDN
jgi:hypothetical protein